MTTDSATGCHRFCFDVSAPCSTNHRCTVGPAIGTKRLPYAIHGDRLRRAASTADTRQETLRNSTSGR